MPTIPDIDTECQLSEHSPPKLRGLLSCKVDFKKYTPENGTALYAWLSGGCSGFGAAFEWGRWSEP